MPRYVDAFALPVPVENVEAYRKMAKKASKIWLEYGALQYIEAVGDDLVSEGIMSFNKVVKPKAGETIVVAYIVYKSRAHRDKVNAKIMKDPRLESMMAGEVPFDSKRMAYGGFKMIVDA